MTCHENAIAHQSVQKMKKPSVLDAHVMNTDEETGVLGQSVDRVQDYVIGVNPLKGAIANLELMTSDLLDRAKANPNEVGAASVEYLLVFGYTAYAYMWALMARTALAKQDQDEFYRTKLGTACFFFARLLPRIHSLTASVKAGSESLHLLDAAQF
jgi:hypothetical protein